MVQKRWRFVTACHLHTRQVSPDNDMLCANLYFPVLLNRVFCLNHWCSLRDAFTQGLEVDGNDLIESTGLYAESTLRRVDPKTGKVKKSIQLESR